MKDLSNITLKTTGQIAPKYQEVIDDLKKLSSGTHRLHLRHWEGSRKHMTLNATQEGRIMTVLDAFGVPFTMGNDAPKGGATGSYIEFKVDRRNPLFKMEG